MDQIILIQEEPRGPTLLVEVPVPRNGLSKQFFPDINQLRSEDNERIIIKGMRLVTPDISVGGVVSNAVNAPLTELRKMFLVLYAEGWEKGEYIPLLTLNDTSSPATTFPHRYVATKFANWKKVDWTKSYLIYANGTVSANAPYVVLFDVDYIKINNAGQEIDYAG